MNLVDRARRRPLAVVLVVAAVLRLAWALYAARSVPETWQASGDQFSYWYYGTEISRGNGYISYITDEATAYYPIGYPALLAAVYWVVTHTPIPDDIPLATALLHTALGTLSVWLLYLVGERSFGRRVGLAAAALFAVFPSSIYGVATYSVEIAFIASSLGALALVVTHDWAAGPPSGRRTVAIAIVLGLSAIIRPFSLPILLAMAAAFVVAGHGWRPLLRTTAVIVAILVVMFTPWTLRNAERFDTFVPFSNNLGDTMCLSRFPGSNGGFAFVTHEWCADVTLPEEERNPANVRAALRFIVENPGEEAVQIVKRLRLMMSNDRVTLEEVEATGAGRFLGDTERRILGGLADLVFFVTMAASVVGVVIAVRSYRRRPAAVATLITSGFLLLIPLGLWGAVRFHVPLIPYMCVYAALAVLTLSGHVQPSTTGDESSEAPQVP